MFCVPSSMALFQYGLMGVMCLCVGVYELYGVHFEGGRVHYSEDPLRSIS